MRVREGRARKERMWLGWVSLIVQRGTQPQAWGAAHGVGNSYGMRTLREALVRWDPWMGYWCLRM